MAAFPQPQPQRERDRAGFARYLDSHDGCALPPTSSCCTGLPSSTAWVIRAACTCWAIKGTGRC